MARRSIEEFLWLKLDGELDPEERRELEAYCREHPEEVARQESELDEFFALFAGAEVEPPPVLRGKIEWAIAERRASAKRSPRVRRWSVRYAYLAAGLVLGIVSAHLFSPGSTPFEPDVSQVQGTLSPDEAVPGEAALVLDLAESLGSLALSRDGNLLRGELSLEGEIEGEPVLTVVDGGQVVLRIAGGRSYSLAVAVADGAARVTVSLATGGNTLLEEEVSLAELPRAP